MRATRNKSVTAVQSDEFCLVRDVTGQVCSSLCSQPKSAPASLKYVRTKIGTSLCYIHYTESRAALGRIFIRVCKTRLGRVVSRESCRVKAITTQPHVQKQHLEIRTFAVPVPKRLHPMPTVSCCVSSDMHRIATILTSDSILEGGPRVSGKVEYHSAAACS